MTRTYQYNNDTAKHVFNQLQNFKQQGNTKDYEVRIDNLTVVQRTKNLDNFHLFKQSLNQFTEAVSILLYKGSSRNYDKYVLTRKTEEESKPDLASEEYLKQRLDDWIKKRRRRLILQD